MARLLLVDDDPEQITIRKLLLEFRDHEVWTAEGAREAIEVYTKARPRIVIMDLRIPEVEDGIQLIRELRGLDPDVRILVLSGCAIDLRERPEAALADEILDKPVLTEQLMRVIAKLAVAVFCLLAWNARAQTVPFQVKNASEVAAEIEMRSPGSDWSKAGREAALADIAVDGSARQNVMLWAGERPYRYSVFLGRLEPGPHRIEVSRNNRFSAPGSKLELLGAAFREDASPELAYAPVLFARRNTIGKFTDAPLLAYCERLTDRGRPVLQYTVIFTNEDGGTPTRALMARWGRTTDIEYIYRAWLDPAGKIARATIQTKDHKEVEYRGDRFGGHPVLVPITDNNMVAPDAPTPIRYQLAPVAVRLGEHSREEVMDGRPELYRVMAQELEREGKLRPFGTVDGANISDPRNYIYIEAKIGNWDSRISAVARLDGERHWRQAHLGRIDYAIERDGWIRTALELPPGSTPGRIAEIGFECLVNPGEKGLPTPVSGTCAVEQVGKAFFLGADYRPQASFWSMPDRVEIPSGETATWTLRSK